MGTFTRRSSLMPQDVQLNRVTKLGFGKVVGKDEMEIFARIISNTPNVQKLYVMREEVDDASLCQAMKNLRHLKELSYDSCSTALVNVLSHHATLGSQSSLRKLSIASYADAARTLIPALYHLQELDIQFHHVRMDHVSLEELSRGCPALERLPLYCDYGIKSALILKIRLLPMLTTVSSNRSSASDMCLLSLFKRTTLKTKSTSSRITKRYQGVIE